jgi:hypothetical protein
LKTRPQEFKQPDVSSKLERPPEVDALVAPSDGFIAFEPSENPATATLPSENPQTLEALPLGAHLILRCRKDWRDATIIAISPDKITLSVNAPSGRTYRVRRPPDTLLTIENSLPVIGTGSWRVNFARYDVRW